MIQALFRNQKIGSNYIFGSSSAGGVVAPGTIDSSPPVMIGVLNVPVISTSSFTVGWNQATDNMVVVGYEVSVDTGAPSYVVVGNVLSYEVQNLNPATAYTVRVRAHDASNNKSVALTKQVVTATPLDTASPAWGVGTSINVPETTTSSITASWPAATDNIGVVGYEVSADTGVASYVDVGTLRTRVVSPLLSGTSYTIRVRAYDANGNRSAPITTTVTTKGVIAVGSPITAVSKTSESVSLTQLSPLSSTVTNITYKSGTGQELILFNNSASAVVVRLKGSAASPVTTKGLAGVSLDVSSGLPITVPAKQFVTLKLDNASAFLKGNVTLTANTDGVAFAGLLQ